MFSVPSLPFDMNTSERIQIRLMNGCSAVPSLPFDMNTSERIQIRLMK